MSQVYDNWERLVEATLKRELWRKLALCDSMDSSFSSVQSHDIYFDPLDQDLAGSSRSNISQENEGVGDGDTSVVIFTLSDLQIATENFNPKNLIGKGSSWKLYKGHLGDENMDIAVKQFHDKRAFLVEVLMLTLLRHPNIVNVVGYCSDGEHRITLHEYMPNGSLDDHLFDIGTDKDPLDWDTRLRIAVGAAKALEYLNERANPPVIHRNFKASNILLDANFNPKLSSFGLAKLGPTNGKTNVSTRVMGTAGYCAPEYAATGEVSIKCDVYSFGIVLMEIITGRRVIDSTRRSEEQYLITWARPLLKDSSKFPLMADPLLLGRYPLRAFDQALAVAAMCLQEQDLMRPSMSDVVTTLANISQQSATNTKQRPSGWWTRMRR